MILLSAATSGWVERTETVFLRGLRAEVSGDVKV
jgi:hypothetical protein